MIKTKSKNRGGFRLCEALKRLEGEREKVGSVFLFDKSADELGQMLRGRGGRGGKKKVSPLLSRPWVYRATLRNELLVHKLTGWKGGGATITCTGKVIRQKFFHRVLKNSKLIAEKLAGREELASSPHSENQKVLFYSGTGDKWAKRLGLKAHTRPTNENETTTTILSKLG